MADKPTHNDINNNVTNNGEGIQDIKNVLQGQASNLHSPKDVNGNPTKRTANSNLKVDTQQKNQQTLNARFFMGISGLLRDIRNTLSGLTKNNNNNALNKNANVVRLDETQIKTLSGQLTTNLANSFLSSINRDTSPFKKLFKNVQTITTKLDGQTYDINLTTDSIDRLSNKLSTTLSPTIKDLDLTSAVANKISGINLTPIISSKLTGNIDLTQTIGKQITIDNGVLNNNLNNSLTGIFNGINVADTINKNIQPITVDLNDKIDVSKLNESFDNVANSLTSVNLGESIANNIQPINISLQDKINAEGLNNTLATSFSNIDWNAALNNSIQPINVNLNDKIDVDKISLQTPSTSSSENITNITNSLDNLVSSLNDNNSTFGDLNTNLNNLVNTLTPSQQQPPPTTDTHQTEQSIRVMPVVSDELEQETKTVNGNLNNINYSVSQLFNAVKDNNINKTQEKINNELPPPPIDDAAQEEEIANAVENYFKNRSSDFFSGLKDTIDQSLQNKFTNEEQIEEIEEPITVTNTSLAGQGNEFKVAQPDESDQILNTERLKTKKDQFQNITYVPNKDFKDSLTVTPDLTNERYTRENEEEETKVDYEFRNKDLEKLSPLVNQIDINTASINQKLSEIDKNQLDISRQQREDFVIGLNRIDRLDSIDLDQDSNLFKVLSRFDGKLDKLDYNKTITQKEKKPFILNRNVGDIFKDASKSLSGALHEVLQRNSLFSFLQDKWKERKTLSTPQPPVQKTSENKTITIRTTPVVPPRIQPQIIPPPPKQTISVRPVFPVKELTDTLKTGLTPNVTVKAPEPKIIRSVEKTITVKPEEKRPTNQKSDIADTLATIMRNYAEAQKKSKEPEYQAMAKNMVSWMWGEQSAAETAKNLQLIKTLTAKQEENKKPQQVVKPGPVPNVTVRTQPLDKNVTDALTTLSPLMKNVDKTLSVVSQPKPQPKPVIIPPQPTKVITVKPEPRPEPKVIVRTGPTPKISVTQKPDKILQDTLSSLTPLLKKVDGTLTTIKPEPKPPVIKAQPITKVITVKPQVPVIKQPEPVIKPQPITKVITVKPQPVITPTPPAPKPEFVVKSQPLDKNLISTLSSLSPLINNVDKTLAVTNKINQQPKPVPVPVPPIQPKEKIVTVKTPPPPPKVITVRPQPIPPPKPTPLPLVKQTPRTISVTPKPQPKPPVVPTVKPIDKTISIPAKPPVTVKPQAPIIKPTDKTISVTSKPTIPKITHTLTTPKPTAPLKGLSVPTPKGLSDVGKTLSVPGMGAKGGIVGKASSAFSVIGNALKGFFSKKKEQKQPFTIENYLTSNGTYSTLDEIINRRIGRNLKGLGKSLTEMGGKGGQSPNITVNGMMGGQGGGLPTDLIGKVTGSEGGLDVKGLTDKISDAKGIADKVGGLAGKAGGTAAGGAGLAGTAATAAMGAIVAGVAAAGAYGAYKAGDWDDQIGNTNGENLIGTRTDGALANINHYFGEGFGARIKTAWDSGRWSKLWGEDNQLDNQYTAAEHKALMSMGKEKADELKRERQQKIIDERVAQINRTSITAEAADKVALKGHVIKSQIAQITGEENTGLTNVGANAKLSDSQLADVQGKIKQQSAINKTQAKLNARMANTYNNSGFISTLAQMDDSIGEEEKETYSKMYDALINNAADKSTIDQLPPSIILQRQIIRNPRIKDKDGTTKTYLQSLSIPQLQAWEKKLNEVAEEQPYNKDGDIWVDAIEEVTGADSGDINQFKKHVISYQNTALLQTVRGQIAAKKQQNELNRAENMANLQKGSREGEQGEENKANAQIQNVGSEDIKANNATVQKQKELTQVEKMQSNSTPPTPQVPVLPSQSASNTGPYATTPTKEENNQPTFIVVQKENSKDGTPLNT